MPRSCDHPALARHRFQDNVHVTTSDNRKLSLRWWWLLAIAAIAFGTWLRLDQLASQFLLDDEWHAIGQVLHSSLGQIVSHFGVADYSIPLTLYYRGLYQLGALSEWNMRLPLLLAGLALLVGLPWLLRDFASVPARAIALALLAISPAHVYLSRTARPYALVVLLTSFALVAFRRWWHREPHANWYAAGYVMTTVLAGWLHMLSLVFSLVPFLFFGLPTLWSLADAERRDAGLRDIARLAALAAATVLPLVALLAAPLLGDWQALIGKAASGTSNWDSIWRSLLMLLGTGNSAIGAVLVMLAVVGLVRIGQRNREAALYPLCIGTLGVATILLAQPAWIQHPGVLVRYTLPMLPWLLWWLAEGIAAGARRPAIGITIACAAVVGMFLSGPIPGYWYRPNQLMASPLFQFDYDPAHNSYRETALIPDLPMPPFYQPLAKLPPESVTLAVGPWSILSWSLPQAWYQKVHRQDLKALLLSGVCEPFPRGDWPESRTGMAMRNYVHLAAILRGESTSVDYVVLRTRSWALGAASPSTAARWPDIEACLPEVRAVLGPPVYRDQQIVVFTTNGGSADRPTIR